jgi:hypothetical protein
MQGGKRCFQHGSLQKEDRLQKEDLFKTRIPSHLRGQRGKGCLQHRSLQKEELKEEVFSRRSLATRKHARDVLERDVLLQ